MAHFRTNNGYTVIKRHYVVLLISFVKFLFLLMTVILLYWLFSQVLYTFNFGYLRYLFFIFIMVFLHYAFIGFVLKLIAYYFNLIVIYKDQIVFIKCTLLFIDDIEMFDSYRIVKVDGYLHGIFANVLGYGNLVIEQQKNDVRIFHFVPKPYHILMIINKQRESVLKERRKKYIVSETGSHKESIQSQVQNLIPKK